MFGVVGESSDDGDVRSGFFEPFERLFTTAAEQGSTFGELWAIVLPATIAIFFVMVLFGGVRYTTEIIQKLFHSWWTFAIVLIVFGIVTAAVMDVLPLGDDDAPEPAPAVAGE